MLHSDYFKDDPVHLCMKYMQCIELMFSTFYKPTQMQTLWKTGLFGEIIIKRLWICKEQQKLLPEVEEAFDVLCVT